MWMNDFIFYKKKYLKKKKLAHDIALTTFFIKKKTFLYAYTHLLTHSLTHSLTPSPFVLVIARHLPRELGLQGPYLRPRVL